MQNKHWLESLNEAEALKKEERYEDAYKIMRDLYEKNSIRYD